MSLDSSSAVLVLIEKDKFCDLRHAKAQVVRIKSKGSEKSILEVCGELSGAW